MFANSPFAEGRDSGYKSWRQHQMKSINSPLFVVPDALFEKSYGLDDWVMHVLNVPMIVIVRNGAYIAVSPRLFQDMVGVPLPELSHLPEHERYLTEQDLLDHLTNVKPEILLKPNLLLEFRAADIGPSPAHWMALTAFWIGIFYNDAAFKAAEEYVSGWPNKGRFALQQELFRDGLKTAVHGKAARDVLPDLLEISRQGLLQIEPGAASMLDLLFRQVGRGVAPADIILEKFRKNGGDMPATLRQSFLFFPEHQGSVLLNLAKAG